ncbi:MAG: EAL domain-containing protein [Actinomycetota bacterium]|nr:EAL domain-containing protein [Actinomycetota bacterium]
MWRVQRRPPLLDESEQELLLAFAEHASLALNDAPMSLYGRDAVITASIGVAHVHAGARAEDVLRDADVAMYRAKERGRARIEVFDHGIRSRLLERLETEQALRWALNNGDLRVHYQPIVRAGTRELVAFEALVRWDHPVHGLVAPRQFVPVAERRGSSCPSAGGCCGRPATSWARGGRRATAPASG